MFELKLPFNLRLTNKAVEQTSLEEKSVSDSCDTYDLLSNCLSGLLLNNGTGASAMWAWYKKIAPLREVQDCYWSPFFASIKPQIYDMKEKKFVEPTENIEANDVLRLFKQPNPQDTFDTFVRRFPVTYNITGDLFLMVTAMDENSRPLEFYYIHPQDVSETPSASQVGAQSYHVSNSDWRLKFNRKEVNGNDIYLTADGTKELIKMSTFNPNQGTSRGLSKFSSAISELTQYYSANVHNNSFLEKGARPSGALILPPDMQMTKDQFDALKTSVNSFYGGGANAGNVMVLKGGKDFKELSMNNKDMDYINMMNRVTKQIRSSGQIPPALSDAESMTLNNYEQAKFMFYDTAIFPFADGVYGFLDDRLMRRYDTENGRYVLTYDKKNVDAVKVRENEEADRQIKSERLTLNEGRALLGYEPIEDGDFVLLPTNIIPLGAMPSSEEDLTQAQKFAKSLRSKKDDLGGQLYSEAQIEAKVSQIYG